MECDFCVVFITAPQVEEGRNLAQRLVEEKLAACVNLIPQIESFYRWNGKIEKAAEVLLVAKTVREKVEKLEEWVKANHSYAVPEVIALPLLRGLPIYLDWIKENTG